MYEFMELNPQPFPNAVLSKEDFWFVPTWKRALLFMFLVRSLLDMEAQKPWNKFLQSDLKFNKRMVNRFSRVEADIFEYSDKYNDLPPTYVEGPKNKKKRKLIQLTQVSDSPIKTRFTCGDTSTDDDEDS